MPQSFHKDFAISQLLFENFDRRKSLTGNWKTNVGQSILEEVPVQVNSSKHNFLTSVWPRIRSDTGPGLTSWPRCSGALTSVPWKRWWPGTGRRSSLRSTTAPWGSLGRARRRTGETLPRWLSRNDMRLTDASPFVLGIQFMDSSLLFRWVVSLSKPQDFLN